MIQAGEQFAFVAASGKRTVYEVDRNGDGSPVTAQGTIYRIVNVKTGAVGWATEKWLREGPQPPAQGYFEAAV